MLWWQLLPRRYLVLRPVVSVLAFVLGLLAPWVIPATEAVYATPVIIVLFTLGCWWVTRNWGVTIFCLVGLGLVWNMGWWFQGMQTLALVILATVIVLVLGVPLGVAAAVWRPFYRVITPILDFMQTLPAFVYLIPAIPFFGLGETAALFATVIFAMPPAIRLTTLGIQQVPEELVEAADAFGSTRMQRLIKLELPTAMPSVQAGTNQAVMLSLSMVVIAAMIGAPGLGDVVWTAIQRLNVAQGFEGGISIVILAIILDRVLRSAGQQAQPGAS
ncbi:MAG: ABC transporter permease [Phycisphaeraceae bacterium]